MAYRVRLTNRAISQIKRAVAALVIPTSMKGFEIETLECDGIHGKILVDRKGMAVRYDESSRAVEALLKHNRNLEILVVQHRIVPGAHIIAPRMAA